MEGGGKGGTTERRGRIDGEVSHVFCADRQVVVGNHRDNWAFGAVDPSSGTSTLMDVAKVIGQLRRYSKYQWHGPVEYLQKAYTQDAELDRAYLQVPCSGG